MESAGPIQTKVELNGNPIKIGQPEGTTNQLTGDIIFNGTISVQDYLFLPQQSQVPVGTTVNFSNDGTIVHTATAQDGSFDTGDITPGQVVGVTFNSAGNYIYNCAPHPWMLGRVVVQ
jgi:plastocyanin